MHQRNYFYSTAYWNVIFRIDLLNFVDKYFKALPKKVSFTHEQIKYFDNMNSVQVFHYQFLQKLHHFFLVPLWNEKQAYISVQLQDSHFDLSDINAKGYEACLTNRRKECLSALEAPKQQPSLHLLKVCYTFSGFHYFYRRHSFPLCGGEGCLLPGTDCLLQSWPWLHQHPALPYLSVLGNASLGNSLLKTLPKCHTWCFLGNPPLCGSLWLPQSVGDISGVPWHEDNCLARLNRKAPSLDGITNQRCSCGQRGYSSKFPSKLREIILV